MDYLSEIKMSQEKITESVASIEGLSNFRYNRVGGVNAYRVVDEGLLETTLTDEQVKLVPAEIEILPFNIVQYRTAMAITTFKSDREDKLKRASVTISTSKTFDADELSITRLNNAINAARNESSEYIIPWSTADVPTGVMVDCTKGELEEAHTAAVVQMGLIWKV